MEATEGEILKNRFTEDFHVVKKIENERVILENGNGTVWISLEKKDLGTYYEKVDGR